MIANHDQNPHMRVVEDIYSRARTLSPKKLAIIQVGDNQASNLYISIKQKRLKEVGFLYEHLRFPEEVSKSEFDDAVKSCADNSSVDAIIVQLPIPRHLLPSLELIPPYKDADGVTLYNQALLFRQADPETYIAPATALGCIAFLKAHSIDVSGKQVAVFGKSFLVGKPICSLLQADGATVVSFSRQDPKQKELSSRCEILVAAIGVPNYITPEYVKPGAFIVDIGTTKVDNKIVGDVHSDVREKAAFVSTTRGGIGPLTVAFLISNLIKCSELKDKV